MISSHKLLIAGLLLASMSPLSSHPAQSENSKDTQPFSLKIETQNKTLSAGAALSITVTLTNISPAQITIERKVGSQHGEMNTDVFVLDQDGKAVPASRYWKRLKNSHWDIGSSVTFKIKPGESIHENIEISRLYDLSEPGTYTIQAQEHVPANLGVGIVKSNELIVTVTN